MKHPPRLHIVTGKGGVGKTSVACALALAYARRGHNVLLAEVNGGDRVADAFGFGPIGYAGREVAPRVFAMDLTPEDALREYVLLTIKVEAIYRSIFESRLVSSFLRLLPALGELNMLGKIWYEWSGEAHGGRPRYDAIVLDAPATGHARALLSAGEAVQRSVPPGPMRDIARRIDAMLKAATSQVDVVTTAEDMPVTEAEELVAFAQAQKFARCTVVANQVVAPLSEAAVGEATRLGQQPPQLGAACRCLLRRHRRATRGAEVLRRLEAHLAVQLPSLSPQYKPTELLQALAEAVHPLLISSAAGAA